MNEKGGCLSLLLGLFGLSPKAAPQEFPFQKRKWLLSKAERSFFGVLQLAIGSRYYIFPMVRLADIISVEKGTKSRQSHFNRIQAKHIDFLLCDPESITPLLAIELDDSSHKKPDRQKRDEFVNAALSNAGLPLLRVPVKHSYEPEALKAEIATLISQGEE